MSNPPKPHLRTDYLQGTEALTPFYQYPVQHPDFSQIIADKSRENPDRALLQTVIQEQYEGLELSPKGQENLDALSDSNTFTVTTGHQLVFFGGPLFTLYKVLHTIRLAEYISQHQPSHRVVPIFWIHTEDHDFEEINHYYRSFEEKITYPGQFTGPVGMHALEPSVLDVIPEHFTGVLQEAFQPGRSLADAYRRFMHELFGQYGLLMLDASDPRLKGEFRRMILEELNHPVSQEQVEAYSARLGEAGYPQQINAREINLFYMDADIRKRIVRTEDGNFQVLDTEMTFSGEEMKQLVEAHPEKFSPNVVLRPLYQETILPNLAYMGGWGELSYWLQLKGVFEHFGVNYPLLLPRFSATLIPQEIATSWQELELDLHDFRKPLSEINQEVLPRVWQDGQLKELEQELEGVFDRIEAYLSTLSDTLPRSVIGQKVKNGHFFKNLEKKISRTVQNQQPIFRQIQILKDQVQPDNQVQERVLSLGAFEGYSPAELVRIIYDCCDPLEYEHRCIVLA